MLCRARLQFGDVLYGGTLPNGRVRIISPTMSVWLCSLFTAVRYIFMLCLLV